MKIIAVANQKGGCGKTTTAINLAASLSRRNRRVLLIDCDPQAHATLGLNVDSDDEQCLYHVLTAREDERLDLEDIIVPIRKDFDLAPSGMMLGSVEHELAEVQGRENMLLQALLPVKRSYDYIILDCPPSIGHLCFNALRACTDVIIPIDMSLFSLRGVIKLVDIILFLKNTLDHDIQIRAMITMFDNRTRYAWRVLKQVKEEFGENVYETVIRYNIRLRETVDFGLPVGDYDRHAIGHKDYERLADEVLAQKIVTASHAEPRLSGAQVIAQNARSYIDRAGQSRELSSLTAEIDDMLLEGPESSYSDMIDVIARGTIDYFGGDD
jgi:chromosome partitioning protein